MPETIDIAKTLVSNKPVDYWEIYLTTSRSFRVEVRDSLVDSLQRSSLKGMAIRVIKDHRSGFSFCTSSDPGNMEKAINSAVEMAGVTPPDELMSFTERESKYSVKLDLLSDKLTGMPEKDKIEIARMIEKEAYAFDKRISVARSSGYVDSITDVRLLNSSGLDLSDCSGICSAWVELMAEESGDQETAYWFDHKRDPDELEPGGIAKKAAGRAINALGGKSITSGKLPVIFENHTASGLLGVISSSFVAENHFKQTASPLVTKGAKLFADRLKIVDDGSDWRGDLAFGFDGEGVPTQKTVVVSEGAVTSWLYDRYYGFKFDHPSTGNSRRSGFEAPPSSGVTNLFIEPGKDSLDKMIRKMGNGILVTEMMGLHTANPVSGDFSVGAAGFKVSNGLIEHPVKGIAIAGNLIDLFGQVIEVGNDFQFFGNLGASSLLCETISVSGG